MSRKCEVTSDVARVVHGHGLTARVDLARGESFWDPTALHDVRMSPTLGTDGDDSERYLQLGGRGCFILRDDRADDGTRARRGCSSITFCINEVTT